MNSNFKSLLDLYLDHGLIRKEISAFARFYEETQAKFDLAPSLTHTETLLKDLNAVHLPSLVSVLTENDISKKARESSLNLTESVQKINQHFESKVKESEEKKAKRNQQLISYIDNLQSN